MSLGSCLVSNEPSGQAEAFIQARIEGKSWAQIAEEFNLPNPGAARKAFQKATGISDFKIKGQALKDLVEQGPSALQKVNEAKAAAKKVKALDDVVQKHPPVKDLDLTKHKLEWPEPEAPSIKTKMNKDYGLTDTEFEQIKKLYFDGKHYLDVVDDFYPNVSATDMKSFFKFLEEEHKAKQLADAAAHKVISALEEADPYDVFKGKWDIAANDDVQAHLITDGDYFEDPRFTKKKFNPDELWAGQDVKINMEAVDKLAQHPIKFLEDEPVIVARINGKNVIIDGHHRAIAAAKRGDKIETYFIDIKDHISGLPKAVLKTVKKPVGVDLQKVIDDVSSAPEFKYNKISDNVLEQLNDEKLTELHEILMQQKINDIEALESGLKYAEETLKEAEKKFGKYSGPWEDAYEEWGYTKDLFNEYVDNVLPKLDADINKVTKLLGKKPALIPDIPVNQPVAQTFKSTKQIANDVGLTPTQVDQILELNAQGHGYLHIKTTLNVEFPQIDEVVWNHLLEKNGGFTWKAYLEKPTSESGYNAVKAKVYEARSKGLTVQEIAGKPGAPPEGVIDAILKDKWQLPSAGAKVPHVPPPPPPPPQVFGGTIPSQSGVVFKRHTNSEMLRWIEPDTAGLSAAERKAITNYTNSGYHDINSYLRGGGLTDDHGYGYNSSNIVKTIENLDKTMRPIEHDITVTRNFSGVHHLPAEPQDMVGLVYHDNAFMSTTVKESGVFSGDVQLIISAPRGTMARYVNDISIHKSEEELLLARGTKMVVTKVEKHGDGYSTRWRLFCEVIAG